VGGFRQIIGEEGRHSKESLPTANSQLAILTPNLGQPPPQTKQEKNDH